MTWEVVSCQCGHAYVRRGVSPLVVACAKCGGLDSLTVHELVPARELVLERAGTFLRVTGRTLGEERAA